MVKKTYTKYECSNCGNEIKMDKKEYAKFRKTLEHINVLIPDGYCGSISSQ